MEKILPQATEEREILILVDAFVYDFDSHVQFSELRSGFHVGSIAVRKLFLHGFNVNV